MTHEQEARELPWYHDGDGKVDRWYTPDPDETYVSILDPYGRGIATVYTGRFGSKYVKPLLDAPATAAERDALKQQVAILTAQRDKAVEALKAMYARYALYCGDNMQFAGHHDVAVMDQAAAVVREIENA